MFTIIPAEEFVKKSNTFMKKHPDLKDKYRKTINLLSENPYHPSLRLHKIYENIKNKYSVSINMKYRIIILFKEIEEIIILVDIGTHKEVY